MWQLPFTSDTATRESRSRIRDAISGWFRGLCLRMILTHAIKLGLDHAALASDPPAIRGYNRVKRTSVEKPGAAMIQRVCVRLADQEVVAPSRCVRHGWAGRQPIWRLNAAA